VKLHFTYAGKALLFHTSAVKAAVSNVHLDDKFGFTSSSIFADCLHRVFMTSL